MFNMPTPEPSNGRDITCCFINENFLAVREGNNLPGPAKFFLDNCQKFA
jgi:hypothetical protein